MHTHDTPHTDPGPTTTRPTPAQLAGQAAEAVRALNHATTGPGGGYAYASDVDAVLAEVSSVLHRLPQALTQAGAWLRDADRHGLLGHDAGESTHLALRCVTAWLDATNDTLREAAHFIEQARTDTHHLTGGRP